MAAPLTRVRWWRSLRVRIALTLAVLVALTIGGVSIAVAQQSADDGRTRLREQAFERLEASAVAYAVYGRLRSGASLDGPQAPRELLDGVRPDQDTSWFDGQTMWVARPLETGRTLVVSVPADDYLAWHNRLLGTLWLAGGLGVGAATLASWLIAGGLSRRLRRGADAAHAIASGAPDQRATQPGSDEVAILTATVDELADALTARLEREREFSADVAHELRTPVTALVSAAELLGDDEASGLVRQQVLRLRVLVEQLLELARLESGHERARTEPADLGDAVRRALDALPPGLGATLATTSPATVPLEQSRLDRIIANLVTNSARHGATACHVRVDGAEVTVTDDGPGYPADMLTTGPRRFASRPGGGSGLGLVIASRQASALGGTLTFGNVAEGGACATLSFGVSDASTPDPAAGSPAAPGP